MKRLLVLVLFMVLLASCDGQSASSQPESLANVTFESAENLTEREAIGEDAIMFTLSNDGTMVAWHNRPENSVCTMPLAEDAANCLSLTDAGFENDLSYMIWSPDNRYLALSDESSRNATESDVWLLDIEKAEIRNLTDDGFGGRAIPFADGKFLDMVLTWNASDNQLYFIRVEQKEGAERPQMGVYRISPESGDASQVRDLTDTLDLLTIVHSGTNYMLNGSMSISPDGKKLALAVIGQSRNDPKTGVWTVALSGNDAPVQLASNEDLAQGLPETQDSPLLPFYIGWLDNETVLLFASDPAGSPPVVNNLYLVKADGVSAVFDFSSFTDAPSLIISEDDSYAPIFYSPIAVAAINQGTQFVIGHRDRNITAISFLKRDATGFDTEFLEVEVDDMTSARSSWFSTSSANNLSIVMGQYLIRFAAAE